jgi:hypothetical protein
MSDEFRSTSRRIPAQGITESTLSGRRLASLVTGGAAALALVLAAAIPAKADPSDDLAKALFAALAAGVLLHELKDKDDRDDDRGRLPVRDVRVPSVCAISIEGDERSVSLYPESCLRRVGFDYRLPRCANQASIYGKRDRVYSAQCLRGAGFKVYGG